MSNRLRGKKHIIDLIKKKIYEGYTSIDEFDFDAMVDEITLERLLQSFCRIISMYAFHSRNEFLMTFSHPEFGDPRSAQFMLNDDSYWQESIPHPEDSGKCYTYDPPFESPPDVWHGIRYTLK